MPRNPHSVESRAINFATSHFSAKKFKVDVVSGRKGHGGYDLVATKRAKSIRIEVKGCTREWQIPDLYGSEVGSNGLLVADFLAVVYLPEIGDPYICVIPRSAIPRDRFKKKIGYRIHSSIKKEAFLGKYRE